MMNHPIHHKANQTKTAYRFLNVQQKIAIISTTTKYGRKLCKMAVYATVCIESNKIKSKKFTSTVLIALSNCHSPDCCPI